ncbi:MAG: right-handed parallel beta-helix repeat-containing protein [Pseudomonadota bacterium]
MCQTITKSGSYLVTGNFTANGDCLIVAASFVQIDLGGYLLTGNGTGSGVRIDNPFKGRKNIDVLNGVVTSFLNGVDLESATGSSIQDVRAFKNTETGLRVSSNSLIANSISEENGGIGVSLGGSSRVSNSISIGNGSHGILIGGAIDGVAVGGGIANNNISRANAGEGIVAFQGNGNVVRGNSVTNNGGNGISAVGSTVQGNAVIGNKGHGINAGSGVVRENSIIDNGLWAIYGACPLAANGNSMLNNASGNIFAVAGPPGCNFSDNAPP